MSIVGAVCWGVLWRWRRREFLCVCCFVLLAPRLYSCCFSFSPTLQSCTSYKYDPGTWGELSDRVGAYLGGIYAVVGAWLSVSGTPEDADFDNCWEDWVRMDNTGYGNVEDQKENYMVEEYLMIAEVYAAENFCRENLLEVKYELLQRWLADEGMGNVYDHFLEHLFARRVAGQYPGPPVCSLTRF